MHVGMIEQGVHRLLVAVHHVEHAVGQPRLLEQLGHAHAARGHFLGRLEDEGIAAGDRHREHPQRHHRREIERRDAGAHAHRLEHGVAVDAAADVLGMLALEQMRSAAGELDHFDAALHRAGGVGQGLAVLLADERCEFSLRVSISSRKRVRMRARRSGVVSRQPGNAALAAAAALSTSACRRAAPCG